MDIDDLLSEISSAASNSDLKFNKEPKTLRIDGHLNAPISLDECAFLLTFDTFRCRRHRLLKQIVEKYNINKTIYDLETDPWTVIKKSFLSYMYLPESTDFSQESLLSQYQAILKSSISVYSQQKCMLLNRKDFFLNGFSSNFSECPNELDIYNCIIDKDKIFEEFRMKRMIESFKDLFAESEYPVGSPLTVVKGELLMEKEVSFIKIGIGNWVLCPTNLILSVMDHLQCMFSLSVYLILSDKFSKYSIPIYSRYRHIYDYVEEIRCHYGEGIYDILKSWDSYVIGRICADNEHDVGYSDLYHSIVKKLNKIMRPNELVKLQGLFFNETNEWNEEVKISLEFSSLQRFFGHPCLEPLTGYHDLRDKVLMPLDIDEELVQEVKCTFIYAYCKGYIEKHNKWPNISFIGDPGQIIYTCHLQNRWLSRDEDNKVPIGLWGNIEIQKNSTFDMTPDTAELLSDKACAPPLSHWTQGYDECAFFHLHGQAKPKLERQETRVMLRYCKGHPGELSEVVDEIERGEDDPENDLAIVCRKERELKRTARCFCKQPYRQRLVQTAKESNIKNNIFPYLKYQTMSDSEINMRKKCANITRLLTRGDSEVINMDIMSWNMFQRAKVNLIFDRIFSIIHGLKRLYEQSHKWASRCYVMPNNRLTPPRIGIDGKPIPVYFCHINQKGGFEGYNQKCWTIPLQCIIILVARILRIRIVLIGQGDNQVFIILWEDWQLDDKERLRAQLLETLENYFKRLGMTLKRDETWVSENLFEYGKKRSYKGQPVPSGIKRAKRCIPDENDGVSTFEGYMTSISTCTENIALNDYRPDAAFIIHNIEILSLFYRKRALPKRVTNDEKCHLVLQGILYWNVDFGGLPISNLPNHIVRGISDKVTLYLSFFLVLRERFPELYRIIRCLISLEIKRRKNFTNLVTDIYSLNIIKPTSSATFIKEQVKSSLKNYATNKEILDVLTSESSDISTLAEKLISTKDTYLPLIHEIVRNSDAGMILSLSNRLTNVQSILRMVDSERTTGVYDIIRAKDCETKLTTRKTLINILSVDTNRLLAVNHDGLESLLSRFQCSMQAAQDIRNRSWGIEVDGVTHPVPWEQFFTCGYDSYILGSGLERLEEDGAIFTYLDRDVCEITRMTNDQHFYKHKLGPFTEYFGSVTKGKLKKANLQLEAVDPYLKSIQNLITIRSWVERAGGGLLMGIIDSILETKMTRLSDESIQDIVIQSSAQSYGGNLGHRFETVLKKMGALTNNIAAMTSHIKTTTTGLKIVSRGGDDYNIFFQLQFLFIEYIIIDEFSRYIGQLEPVYATVLNCRGCLKKLPLEPLGPVAIAVHSQGYSEEEVIPDTLINNIITGLRFPLLVNTNIHGLMSLLTGISIGNRIDRERTKDYSSVVLLEEAVQVATFEDINLTQVRYADIQDILIGVIISSDSLRADLFSAVSSSEMRPTNPMLYPLISSLMITNRYKDLLSLLDLYPSTYLESVEVNAASNFILKSLRRVYAECLHPLILEVINTQFEDLNMQTNPRFWSWILIISCTIKLKELGYDIVDCNNRIKQLRYKVRLTSVSSREPDRDDLPGERIRHERSEINAELRRRAEVRSEIAAIKNFRKTVNKGYLHLHLILERLKKHHAWSLLSLPFDTAVVYPPIDQITMVWRLHVLPQLSIGVKFHNLTPLLKTSRIASRRNILVCPPPTGVVSVSFMQNAPGLFPGQPGDEVIRMTNLLRHTSRIFGYHTGSATEYYCVLREIWGPYKLDEATTAVCLADGEGGVSNLLLHMMPGISNLGFNTLKTNSLIGNIEPSILIPPVVNQDICSENLQRLKGLEILNHGETDILDPEFSKKLLLWSRQFSHEGGGIDLLICDLESDIPSDYYILSGKIPELHTSLSDTGILIIKIRFLSIIMKKLSVVLDSVHHHFIKPPTLTLQHESCILLLPMRICDSTCPYHYAKCSDISFLQELVGDKEREGILLNRTYLENYSQPGLLSYTCSLSFFLSIRDELRSKLTQYPCVSRYKYLLDNERLGATLGCVYLHDCLSSLYTSSWENIISTNPTLRLLQQTTNRKKYLTSLIHDIIATYLLTRSQSVSHIINSLIFLSNCSTDIEYHRNTDNSDDIFLQFFIKFKRDTLSPFITYQSNLLKSKMPWVLDEEMYCVPLSPRCSHTVFKKELPGSRQESLSNRLMYSLNMLDSLFKRVCLPAEIRSTYPREVIVLEL